MAMYGWEMVLRSLVIFASLLIWTRILGRKIVTHLTFFDFVAGIAIGSISANIMFYDEIPLIASLAGLSVFALLTLVIDFVTMKSGVARKMFMSEPIPIIEHGRLLTANMSKSRLTYSELLLLLRKKDVFYLDEVDLAYFEVDGTISVLRKSPMQPAVRADCAGNPPPPRGKPLVFVLDGRVQRNNLREAGKDEAWLEEHLRKAGDGAVGDVAFMQWDRSGRSYIQLRDKDD